LKGAAFMVGQLKNQVSLSGTLKDAGTEAANFGSSPSICPRKITDCRIILQDYELSNHDCHDFSLEGLLKDAASRFKSIRDSI
jgi:hypothetical protein